MLNLRYIFPAVLLIWFFLYTTLDAKSLRGSNAKELKFEVSQAAEKGFSGVDIIVPNHLVVVPGHAVMKLNKLSVSDKSESAWYLLKYQIGQGFPAIISSHVRKGIDIVESDPAAVLVFSGGQTRKDVGPTSEAASYYYLADEKKWLKKIPNRVYLEEYARDSFENLLFSMCRFKEATGQYPSRITVVGFDFKMVRYTDLHRAAVKFPLSNFTYIGVNSATTGFDQNTAIRGEQTVIEAYTRDKYGCNNVELYGKRNIRNPFKRTVPYSLACPEIAELLSWCGPDLFLAPLPWDRPQISS